MAFFALGEIAGLRWIRVASRWLVVLALAAAVPGASAGGVLSGRHYLVTTLNWSKPVETVEILGRTGRVERLVAIEKPGSGLARWSPLGNRLAFAGSAGLSLAGADGRGLRVLVARTTRCRQICVPVTFAWSPDGRRVVMGGAGTKTSRVLSVSLALRKRRDVTPAGPEAYYQVLGWSPDGKLVAYARFAGNPGTGTCCKLELVVAPPTGGAARVLFAMAEPIHDFPAAAWSPDSRSIAFTSDGRDPRDPRLAVVDVASGAVHPVVGVAPMSIAPAWSPRSDRIAVSLAGRGVVTMRPDGTDLHTVAASGSLIVWSRNGALTIVQGARGRTVLESVDGRSRARLLFRLPQSLGLLTIDPR